MCDTFLQFSYPGNGQEANQSHLLPSAVPSPFPTRIATAFPRPIESFADISDGLQSSFASNISPNPTTTKEHDNYVASPVPMDISPTSPIRVTPS